VEKITDQLHVHKREHAKVSLDSIYLEQHLTLKQPQNTPKLFVGDKKENQKSPNLVSPHKNINIKNEYMRIIFLKSEIKTKILLVLCFS